MFEQKEQELLNNPKLAWKDMSRLPKANGVYIIYLAEQILYIGESKNIWDRFWKHHRTGNASSFRANMIKENIESSILDNCTIQYVQLLYGRKELEEYLIEKYKPVFNKVRNVRNQASERKIFI